MSINDQAGWTLVYIIFSITIFYSLGYRAGKKDGAKLGRSVGIRIGERRAREQVGK